MNILKRNHFVDKNNHLEASSYVSPKIDEHILELMYQRPFWAVSWYTTNQKILPYSTLRVKLSCFLLLLFQTQALADGQSIMDECRMELEHISVCWSFRFLSVCWHCCYACTFIVSNVPWFMVNFILTIRDVCCINFPAKLNVSFRDGVFLQITTLGLFSHSWVYFRLGQVFLS